MALALMIFCLGACETLRAGAGDDAGAGGLLLGVKKDLVQCNGIRNKLTA
jgi:hypothetical protein